MDNNSNDKRWHNWAKTQYCNAKILTPKSTEELITIVQKAKKEHATLHAYGSAHSWSDIVCVDGYLINTDKLNKIIDVDSVKNLVTVQAGIKIKDLNKKLAKLGLCLSNQGAITRQSLAGVVSTATHGSGKTGTFASFVTQVVLLTADGTIKKISATENSDLWPAVRTSIGSLGIMLELTIQCEPLFKVQRSIATISWKNALKEQAKLLETNDYMQFKWDAETDTVKIVMHNRVSRKNNHEKNVMKTSRSNEGYSYEMLAGVLTAKYVEEEIAIPMERFKAAAETARDLVKAEYAINPAIDGILFRFVAAEKQNLISPASGQDVCYFSVTTSPKSSYETFFKKFYDAMIQYGGRPHWGKINYLTKDDVKKLYGNNFDNFLAIRKKLDPTGLFSNSFTKCIFGW